MKNRPELEALFGLAVAFLMFAGLCFFTMGLLWMVHHAHR